MKINSWKKIIEEEQKKDYFKSLEKFLNESDQSKIYPPKDEIFCAFNLTPLESIKCVIIGQDPYHNFGQAHGLSFSVKEGIKKPPSLINIFKELKSDLNIQSPDHGNLKQWAERGVFLLNSILTVQSNRPASHRHIGWETFTDKIIKIISSHESKKSFILWGNFARSKKFIINNQNHLILESVHPSPMSAYNGFFGSSPFSKTNNFLKQNNIEPIDWKIQ